MKESDLADPQAAGRGLTWLYVVALTTVAVLSIGAQLLIQRQLDNGESDSRVINVAGRQRMLSQRLAKNALELLSADTDKQAGVREELRATLSEWEKSHAVLQEGDAELGLPGSNSPRVAKLFAEVDRDFNPMRDAATRLLSAGQGLDPQAVETIQFREGSFLDGMDRIVSQYVVEAEARVTRLRHLERSILALTLVVLLAEGLLVFRPAVRRIAEVTEHLRRARDEAEEADVAKTRFLANVSHELRTPMTAVLGMTELAKETESEQKRERYLSVVEEAGETLLGLLNDLIDVARIDSGNIELSEEPFDPGHELRRIGRLIQPAVAGRGLSVRIDSGDAPVVVGDARRLGQVLLNLATNAVKWTDRGSVTLRCELVEQLEGVADLLFEVIDTGAGIAAEDQQRVFEPFTQVGDVTQGHRGGTGLGLAICRRLVEAMGGRITLRSSEGVGTKVSVELRLSLGTLPERDAAPASAVSKTTPLRVLVVEDTEATQLLLREMLTQAGHTVDVVGSGEAAEQCCRSAEGAYDLALIDHQLPGIDGVETASRLREIARSKGHQPPRCVCITAHAALDERPLEPVFEGLVSKPIDRDELLAAIDASVDSEAPPSEADPSLAAALAEAFLRFVDEQRDELVQAIDQERFADAHRIAHRFSGQLGYFDDKNAAEQFGSLERACRVEDNAAVRRQWPEARDALDRLVLRLRAGRDSKASH